MVQNGWYIEHPIKMHDLGVSPWLRKPPHVFLFGNRRRCHRWWCFLYGARWQPLVLGPRNRPLETLWKHGHRGNPRTKWRFTGKSWENHQSIIDLQVLKDLGIRKRSGAGEKLPYFWHLLTSSDHVLWRYQCGGHAPPAQPACVQWDGGRAIWTEPSGTLQWKRAGAGDQWLERSQDSAEGFSYFIFLLFHPFPIFFWGFKDFFLVGNSLTRGTASPLEGEWDSLQPGLPEQILRRLTLEAYRRWIQLPDPSLLQLPTSWQGLLGLVNYWLNMGW